MAQKSSMGRAIAGMMELSLLFMVPGQQEHRPVTCLSGCLVHAISYLGQNVFAVDSVSRPHNAPVLVPLFGTRGRAA